MKENQSNKLLGIGLLAFFVIIITIGLIQRKAFLDNHILGIGRVYNHTSGGRGNAGGTWIDFIINVNGGNYKGTSLYRTIDFNPGFLDKLRGKTFPVLYNPGNPSISSLLLLPEDFRKFGYSFPDSLRWMLPYIRK